MSERMEFVSLASRDGANISRLCERFGISRKTGYKWLNRWRSSGDPGLADRSRRPSRSPGKTASSVEKEVISLRRSHPSWGGRKIRRRLLDRGVSDVPSASTITEILRRHGLLNESESQQHRAFTRFERAAPNDLWQLDFKGEFKLANGRKCYPLTLLDDHSRYSLGIEACGNQRRPTVQSRLRTVFERYGIPRSIYVDNGNPWGTAYRRARHTRLTIWLLRHDIEVIHGRPYHPQGRGKLERFHRTLQLEVLQGRQLCSLKESQAHFDPWRRIYNHERPHEALSLEVPAQRYRMSERSFREERHPYEYSSRYETRTPNQGGQIKFRGKTYRLSEIYQGQRLGLRPTTADGLWEVYYCRFAIATIDERTGRIRRHQPVG